LAARPAPPAAATQVPIPMPMPVPATAAAPVTVAEPSVPVRLRMPPSLDTEDGPRTLDDLLPDPSADRAAVSVVAAPVQPVDVARIEPPPATLTQPVREPEVLLLPEPAAPALQPQPAALDSGTPWLRDMPPGYRADFPHLSVDVHVYNPEAAQRFVLISGRRYREGSMLADGPRLLEIAQDGLILEFRGQQVRYPITR
jgi:general secretion pathway protein B